MAPNVIDDVRADDFTRLELRTGRKDAEILTIPSFAILPKNRKTTHRVTRGSPDEIERRSQSREESSVSLYHVDDHDS